jgi:MoaA/NifB/PqqE/SkfB family radical SAM enzyme
MEINFCDEGVRVGNKTGRITLTVEEIQRLASLVRNFDVGLLDKKLREYQENHRKNAFPCLRPPERWDHSPA